MSAFRNTPIDRRRLSDQDKNDFNRGGGYGEQATNYKRARINKGILAYDAKRQERTTPQTPGTGGQSAGIAIQQERNRRIGVQRDNEKAKRPQMDNSMYDIYKYD